VLPHAASIESIVAALSAFVLVLSLWGIGIVLLQRRRAQRERILRERLDPREPEPTKARTLRLWHEGEEATKSVPGGQKAPPLLDRLEQARKDAGFTSPLRTLAVRALLVLLAAFLVTYVLAHRFVPAAVTTAVVAAGILGYTSNRIAKRGALFERQLVDGLELSARALRAGHPLLGAFHLISEEIPAPVGRIFGEIVQHQALGGSLDDALRRVAALTRNEDMKLFSASLSINLRTGGNLADVVYGLAHVIRERMRLNRRFRVLIAQTQASKRILLLMPVVMLCILGWVNPEYVAKLGNNTPGVVLSLIAAASWIAGWAVMNRMAALKA
jgi:tight adherence protein B